LFHASSASLDLGHGTAELDFMSSGNHTIDIAYLCQNLTTTASAVPEI